MITYPKPSFQNTRSRLKIAAPSKRRSRLRLPCFSGFKSSTTHLLPGHRRRPGFLIVFLIVFQGIDAHASNGPSRSFVDFHALTAGLRRRTGFQGFDAHASNGPSRSFVDSHAITAGLRRRTGFFKGFDAYPDSSLAPTPAFFTGFNAAPVASPPSLQGFADSPASSRRCCCHYGEGGETRRASTLTQLTPTPAFFTGFDAAQVASTAFPDYPALPASPPHRLLQLSSPNSSTFQPSFGAASSSSPCFGD